MNMTHSTTETVETVSIDTAKLAQLCKASSDPLRLDVLRVLRDGSFGVLELCKIFEAKQSGMSHHLKVMATAGLVETRKEGNSIFYRRTTNLEQHALKPLLDSLFSSVDQTVLPDSVQQRLMAVYQERNAVSQQFFEKNAARFREQQDLIASWKDYGEFTSTVASEIKATLVHQDRSSAIEFGPGTGEMLVALSQHFDDVTGVDTSEEMLQQAKATLDQHGIDNVELIHADANEQSQLEQSADLITCNMVLHHVPAPETLIESAAKKLRTGGTLLISDLCAHDQKWTREHCGDIWLGFEQDDIDRWAEKYQLLPESSHYLALRNGFQVQTLVYKKQGLGKAS
jgi:ArsR family transcriptional regulator